MLRERLNSSDSSYVELFGWIDNEEEVLRAAEKAQKEVHILGRNSQAGFFLSGADHDAGWVCFVTVGTYFSYTTRVSGTQSTPGSGGASEEAARSTSATAG
jgi:hypothetical protein